MVREGEGGEGEGCLTSLLIIKHLHHFPISSPHNFRGHCGYAAPLAMPTCARCVLHEGYHKAIPRLLNIK